MKELITSPSIHFFLQVFTVEKRKLSSHEKEVFLNVNIALRLKSPFLPQDLHKPLTQPTADSNPELFAVEHKYI